MAVRVQAHVLLIMTASTLATSSARADDPPKPVDPAAAGSVMFKTADVRIRDERRGPWTDNLGIRFQVKRTEGDHVWIAQSPLGAEMGWVLASEVIPFEQAEAFFTEEIKAKPTSFAYLSRAFSRPISPYRAEGAMADKARDARISDLDEAVRLDPNNWRAYTARGVSFSVKKDHDRAIADFTEAMRANPDQKIGRVGTLISRGNSYSQKGDLDRAFADYDEAISLNPKNYWAYHFKATGLITKKDIEGAIAQYTKLLEVDPESVDAYISRGRVRFSRGDLAHALDDFEAAVRKSPKNPAALFNRGWVKEFKKDFDGAIADYDAVVKLSPRYPNVYFRRAVSKQANRDFVGAIADYDEAIKINPADATSIKNRNLLRKFKP